MPLTEKQASYTSTNSYTTLNQLGSKTKNIWVVLHGIGFLSRYFLKYFENLDSEENYIIAPQAPSKYYLKNEYRHVGASWLTKEKTEQEKINVLHYLDAVWASENLPKDKKLIVLGFSQGVSIAMRWVAHRKLKCEHLVLYAGGIPKELVAGDFNFLTNNATKVTVLVGDQDEYLTKEVMVGQQKRIDELFQQRATVTLFEGGQEMKNELINALV